MKDIHRWLSPEDAEDIEIEIPEDTVVETVQAGETGIERVRLERPEDGGLVVFPEIQVWDDPSRSRVLMREESGWQKEDTDDLLKQWEETRLTQFREHLFKQFHSMQVVFRVPPFVEEIHFTKEGFTYHGWRIEMIATFFAGFKPTGLKKYKPKSSIISDVGPGNLRLV